MKKLKFIAIAAAAMLFVSSTALATIVPSVTGTTAPDLVEDTYTDDDGNEVAYVATAVAADGTVSYLSVDDIQVVAAVDAGSELDTESHETFVAAQEQLTTATTVTEVVPEVATVLETINADLDDDKQVAAEDLVVKELFDLYVPEEFQGQAVTLTFSVDVSAHDAVLVLHNYEGDKWEVVNSTVNSNGTISATFTSFSPVAIVVNSVVEDDGTDADADADTDDDADTDTDTDSDTPTTGDTSNMAIWIVLLAVSGVALIVVVKKFVLKR